MVCPTNASMVPSGDSTAAAPWLIVARAVPAPNSRLMRIGEAGGGWRQGAQSRRVATARPAPTTASAHGTTREAFDWTGARAGAASSSGHAADQIVNLYPRLADGLQATFRVLLEASPDQSSKCSGRGRRQRRPFRIALEHRRQDVGDLLAVERAGAGDHLEQDNAEGPDVRAVIDDFPAIWPDRASNAQRHFSLVAVNYTAADVASRLVLRGSPPAGKRAGSSRHLTPRASSFC